MKRILAFVFVALAFVPSSGISETIDVVIKGIDDGVKTSRQRDYQEALMNARLQAIERAGVEISSITKVVNFETQFDMIESRAKAVLLPGFQVMDIGYQPDGSYMVVLSGKVQVGGGSGSLREIMRDGIYILYEGGIVYDQVSRLEWVAGPDKGMNWNEANAWVDSLSVAGGGWRMPTQTELRGLYAEGAGSRNMTSLLKTTGWWVWAEARDSSSAWGFYFDRGNEAWHSRGTRRNGNARAFAVRSRR